MENTNLNVNPYYDDFSEDKNFHRVLFRPGFAVQARELTQLQTILQNQIERHGRHVFKEGTVVIPGSVGFTNEYYAVKLQSTFGEGDVSDYLSDYEGTIITGENSGVQAEVIQAVSATAADPITLYVKYVSTGTDKSTTVFDDGENIFADAVIGDFGIGINSSSTLGSGATATGSSANIEEGIYFIRGHFVRVEEQRIILDKYTDTPSYRVGLTISEQLITPEDDTSLQDNAQGTSNENAKGAHRLKFTLTLSKKSLTDTDDSDFVELIRVRNGSLQEVARNTEYSVLEETFARRTFDESGDYTVRPFDIDIRENLDDGLNNGIYTANQTTDDGNTPSDDLLTIQVSPGKAYVRGYEIETIAPSFIDVEKPRDFLNLNGAVTPVEVGNYAIINNAYNIPDLSPAISGEVTQPYRTIELYDTQTSSRGQSSGNRIGFARARAIEHNSGNTGSGVDFLADSSTADTEFKLYLFDIRMFTTLTMSGTPDPVLDTGARVVGATSGAIGYVASDSSGTSVVLTTVIGQFTTGEKLKSSDSTEADEFIQNSGSTDLTISSIETFAFDNAKQVFMDDADTGQDFSADLKLETATTLGGLVTIASGDLDAVIGSNTTFESDLKVGDIVQIPSGTNGALEERVVDAVTSDNVLDLDSDVSNDVTSTNITRIRAKLNDQNKNLLLRKLQKQTVKTLKTDFNTGVSDTSVVVRRQFVATSNASGEITLTAGTNEVFNAIDNEDFVISILTAGTGSAAQGDIVNVESSNVSIAGSGTGTLTITSASIFGNSAKVKVVGTLTRSIVTEKSKTLNRGQLVLVDNDGIGGGAEWGTSAHHNEISLGFADVFRLFGVYDSGDAGDDPVLPEFTATSFSGTFTKGEKITGGTTGATGIIINTTSPITYVLTSSSDFSAGEEITGAESSASATLAEQTEVGSTVITNNFTLDVGQRDNYYDLGRLVRKPNAVAPTGKVMVVFDYFSHGNGDFFTVDSYTQIDYKDIPTYTATRVDPEVREPTGEYDLRDSVDFRPRVGDATSTTTTLQNQTVTKITGYSFNFESRSFAGTGSSTISIPKDNSNFQYDLDFYLGRIDMLFLDSDGNFRVIKGASAENPEPPKPLDNAMKLADINLNPFVITIDDVTFEKENNRRYTMRDIGRLENRIANIEYYTALNLLEKDAQSLQIQDNNGLDRFKSGFVVDNFSGHATGDVKHPDYRAAIDMQNGILRPKYYMKGVSLEEENGVDTETDIDTARANDNYRVTGDLVTLPYDDVVAIEQTFATRVENLNPVLSFAWAGVCQLTPSGDEWFEVDRLPDLIINREGNFDTVFAQNQNAIGTVWNAWQTQWSGVTSTSTTRFRERSWQRARRRVPFRPVIERTVTTETGSSTRQGIQTSVVPQIDLESQGDRVLSQALIPFIRSRNVFFSATGMKPLTRVYPFFDKTDVSSYVTPVSGTTTGVLSDFTLTSGGAWTSISRVEFDYDKVGGNPLLFTTSWSRDNTNFNVASSLDQFSGGSRSTVAVDFTGDQLEPNDNGEIYLRGFATDSNALIGAVDRLYDIKVYDQSGNLIPRNRYEIVNNKRWSNVGRAIDGSTDTFASFEFRRYPRRASFTDVVGWQNEITIRVFDGVSSITPSSGTIRVVGNTAVNDDALVVSPAGTVEGIFNIPDPNQSGNPRFRTGERAFRLTSDQNNGDNPETFAQAIYSARGILSTVQETIIATRNGRVETREVSQTRNVTRTDTREAIVGWWDPLAQSFMPQEEGGEYITKIDVFFSQKDEQIPVTCQIREMQNGYPTTKVLPFGSKSLEPSQVSVSNDASVATTFTFDSPVYVKNGVEYCVVLFTDSQKYLCWISRMGEVDVTENRLVSEQPYLGVLFKSQNNTTWSAYDFEDLKFAMYRASFDTSAIGTLTMVNDELPVKSLDANPIQTFNGSNIIKVSHRDHHMHDIDNNVILTGVSSGISTTLDGAITASDTSLTLTSSTGFPSSGTVFVKIEDEVMSGTISGTTISSLTRGVEGTAATHADDVTVELYMLNNIPLTEINTTHTNITATGLDYYTLTVVTNADADQVTGGLNVTATENAMIDQLQTLLPVIEHPNTSVTASVRTTSATSPSGTEQSFSLKSATQAETIPLNDNYLFSQPQMICSAINETNELQGQKSFVMDVQLSSTVDNLSPIIDLDRKSIVCISNRLDNIDSSSDVYPTSSYIAPTESEGDSNEVIYVTRKVQLANPANSIKVLFDAVRPSSSEIQVMFKILRSDDASDFDELGFQFFNTDGSPDTNVNPSTTDDDFVEYNYTADDLGEFIAFAIKIRMQGTNTSRPAFIKDLRAIALAT